MLIAIDGYNLIKQSPELKRIERIDLEKARERLIEDLARYKKIKGHSIIVVFDGAQQGRVPQQQGNSRGIRIVFSRPGEKADDVLKRLAAEKRDGVLLITSDRDIAGFAEKKGAKVLPVSDFAEKMEMARYFAVKGTAPDERLPDRPIAPKKKGPSRRLSKSRRKTLSAAKKL